MRPEPLSDFNLGIDARFHDRLLFDLFAIEHKRIARVGAP
jgi:hypothetical protein